MKGLQQSKESTHGKQGGPVWPSLFSILSPAQGGLVPTGIMAGEEGATAGYHRFMQAGGSRYAMDLFKLAGVDMSSKAPHRSCLSRTGN